MLNHVQFTIELIKKYFVFYHQALHSFTMWQLKEIAAIGTSHPNLAADRSEQLGLLNQRTKAMANAIQQRSEKLRQFQQWMQSFQRLYTSTSRRLQEVFISLQKAANYRDPMWLLQAVQLCDVRHSFSFFFHSPSDFGLSSLPKCRCLYFGVYKCLFCLFVCCYVTYTGERR